jgi:hypothetical protein
MALTHAASARAPVSALRAPVLARTDAVKASRAASRVPRARHRASVRCQVGGDTLSEGAASTSSSEAPAGETINNALAARDSNPADAKDSMRRAREIMSVDPTAENALDLVGTKVGMKCVFKVHYETKLGEDLFVIGSHEKLGAWDIVEAVPMVWGEGGNWTGEVELPAGGVFFYKYVVKTLDQGFRWQEGANNLLALPDPWDVPKDSQYVIDDQFGGLTKEAQNRLAVKLVMTEKEKVTLKVEANKAKEMTKAALQELLLAREELREAKDKLQMYESNMNTVVSAMNDPPAEAR